MSIQVAKTDHVPATLTDALPDWVEVYFNPSAPANRVEPPHQSVLDQMYAYYEA